MLPFDEKFRKIASECRQVGKLKWDSVFQKHGLSQGDIDLIKREDLERQHWGSGY